MNLYQINQEIENFKFEIDEETGEILNLMQLDELNIAKEEKIESIALWIKNLKAEAEAIKNEIDTLNKRVKTKMNKAASLSEYLKSSLDGKRFETGKVVVSYRKSTKVEVDDEFINYAKSEELYDFYTENVTYKADLKAIKEHLKQGGALDHCQLVENNNIQIK